MESYKGLSCTREFPFSSLTNLAGRNVGLLYLQQRMKLYVCALMILFPSIFPNLLFPSFFVVFCLCFNFVVTMKTIRRNVRDIYIFSFNPREWFLPTDALLYCTTSRRSNSVDSNWPWLTYQLPNRRCVKIHRRYVFIIDWTRSVCRSKLAWSVNLYGRYFRFNRVPQYTVLVHLHLL